MQQARPARLLRIHISESDRYQGKPLYEAIVAKCRELKIAGATVFRGLEGYGETAEMHKAHLIRHDQPIVISIVDSAENLALLAPAVEEMLDTGMMAVSEVRMVRVQKKAAVVQDGKSD
jgi:PII-like signaling protein